ncbi:solute carrier family 13 member 5 [Rhipicephalus sanguineus]|uniref:solute carrier family 13 member 5 n=1 Tax=Rhipicephalus sanguineus TaxID=34632 RepID=UPI001892FE0A|nr:solute carrier family 13 member 5 [Rhipicephalus sanguineus]
MPSNILLRTPSMASAKKAVARALKLWRQILMVLVPLVLLPMIFLEDAQKARCAYVVAVVGLYWIIEPIPLGATSLIPIVLFPMLGVLTTEQTCVLYMNETNIMFVGTLIMAIAIEHSHLHQRIALKTLCLLGTGIKMLVFGIMFISMFLSIWINNVAITAMMMPVINSLSHELLQERRRSLSRGNIDVEGIAALRERAEKAAAANGNIKLVPHDDVDEEESDVVIPIKPKKEYSQIDKATEHRVRVLLYLSVLYGANIGTITTITSGASNVVFKFVIEDLYKERAPVDYALWMFFALPIALIGTALVFVIVVPFFFSCKSPNLGKESSNYAMAAIRRNYMALGPIRFHEVAVLLLFILLVFLWLFRDPMFAKGWATYFGVIKPKDATAVMIPVILLFMIPSKPQEGFRGPVLLTWKMVQAKLQWSVILLIGSGFAIAEAMRVSGLSEQLGLKLAELGHLSPGPLMICLSIICSFMSELISNCGTCTVLLPVFAVLAEDLNLNPLLFMIPTTIASNYAFMLPVGTPANAMVYEHGRLTIMEMVVPGLLAKLITMVVTVVVTYVLGDPIFGMFHEADWLSAITAGDANTTIVPVQT